jgi:hypothetical protein
MPEPIDYNPGHAEAAALFAECDALWDSGPTPLADAAMAFLRRSLADLAAVETVADLLYACGEE